MKKDLILYIPIYGMYRACTDVSILLNSNEYNLVASGLVQSISISYTIIKIFTALQPLAK